MSVMDYYDLQNLQADTKMREKISASPSEGTADKEE